MNLAIILCEKVDASNVFWVNIFFEIAGALIFLVLYEKIYKNASDYFKNEKYIGKFFHCDMNYNKILTGQNEHYSEIRINFWKPNILIINSQDFGWPGDDKTWVGQIKIDPDTGLFGFGTFKYLEPELVGNHDVIFIDDDVFRVQLSFLKNKDSGPYLMVKKNSSKLRT